MNIVLGVLHFLAVWTLLGGFVFVGIGLARWACSPREIRRRGKPRAF